MAMEELDAPVLYPVHPRNRDRALRLMGTYHYKNLKLVPPVKYSESGVAYQPCEKDYYRFRRASVRSVFC